MWAFIGKEGFKAFKGLSRVHDFRVLMAFLERMDEQNVFRGGQVDIALDLGISRQCVCLSFKRLQEAGIILKSCKDGVKLFHLNSDLGRKGNVKVRLPIYEKGYQDYRDEELEAAAD